MTSFGAPDRLSCRNTQRASKQQRQREVSGKAAKTNAATTNVIQINFFMFILSVGFSAD
jgi:hypothetical protein